MLALVARRNEAGTVGEHQPVGRPRIAGRGHGRATGGGDAGGGRRRVGATGEQRQELVDGEVKDVGWIAEQALGREPLAGGEHDLPETRIEERLLHPGALAQADRTLRQAKEQAEAPGPGKRAATPKGDVA